ncbi:MAG TPA: acyl-CoA dehydratase activase [Syntrophorhabdaceae bacterium]|nr:acyl-CoA dehydratase activase [Syntrophorhabdaceae bacterium]
MMLTAGIDIGAGNSKAVVLRDSEIAGTAVIPTGHDMSKAASDVIREACLVAGCSLDEIKYIVTTGWGRNAVPFSTKVFTEILCQAKGIHFLIPEARTIIDIGAQDTKVIRINNMGLTNNFVMNDKCAAGTGKFLDIMAKTLEVDMSEMGSFAMRSTDPCQISSTCAVFAETEVISLLSRGRKREDVLHGIHRAVCIRTTALVRTVDCEEGVVFTGGVSQNTAMKKFLEDALKRKIVIPQEPEITCALGAALIAENTALTEKRI